VCFFHPVFGLSGFEEESTLRVCDLVQAPEENANDWNFARAGAPALPELNSVVLLQPPSIEDIFGGAPEEIGSEPPVDLPPAAGEPKEDPISKATQSLKRTVLKSIAAALRQAPHRGSQRTWVNSVEDWAARGLRGLNEQ